MINGLLEALFVVLVWLIVMIKLAPRIRKSSHFSLLGPALMIKSPKNRGILDKFSRIFPKELTSRVSVAIVLVTMLGAFIFLFYEVYLSLAIRVVVNQPASFYLALPGINPFIPIFYGTMALVVGVVIHELMHGVLSRKHGITVKSVGALFFVIPVGAFVEPDEEEMMKASPIIRRRIFAAGPATNIVLALIFFLLLMMVMGPLATPTHNGVYLESTQSQISGISNLSGLEITSFGSYSGNDLANLASSSNITPGQQVSITVYNGHTLFNGTAIAGVVVYSTLPGFPAYKSNLSSGDIILSINGSTVWNLNTMNSILDNITPGTNVTVRALNTSSHSSFYTYIVTVSKYSYYNQYYPLENSQSYRHQSFIGVSVDYAGLQFIPLSDMKSLEFGNYAISTSNFPNGIIEFIILPLQGFSPVPASLESLYSVPFFPSLFWVLANSFYWLFWMNFLLGLTNALPLFILDGGQFFKDTLLINSTKKGFRFLTESRVKKISNFFGILVLVLLMWNLIIPRIL